MVVEETADFQQLPGAHPRHQASRQSWSVAIRNFLTSPFPFDCSGLLGSGKCCSVIISCGCGCRPVWCARIGAKSFFPVDEHSTVGARASQSPLRAPAVLLGATWAPLVLLGASWCYLGSVGGHSRIRPPKLQEAQLVVIFRILIG